VVITATWVDIEYTVTVTGGEPSEPFGVKGDVITLTVGDAPSGQKFKEWNVIEGGVEIDDDGFTIGTANVVIEAVWDFIVYTISVTSGTPSEFTGIMGDVITLTPDMAPIGMKFSIWIVTAGGIEVEDDEFTIGTANVIILAAFEFIEYTVTVTGGTASADSGIIYDEITLTVGTAPEGQKFKEWDVTAGGVEIEGDKFTIRTANVVIAAVWEDVYTVSVTGGTASEDSGITGEVITLTAGTAPEGQKFKEWDVIEGNVTVIGNVFTIGTANVVIAAVWEDVYTVSVTGGTASEDSGITGDVITLTVGTAPAGQKFKEWDVIEGDVTVIDNVFTIGTENVVIAAVWEYIVYTVTVNGVDEDGGASADSGTIGEVITLTIGTAPEGEQFLKWDVIEGNVTVIGNVFTIGTENVVIEAVWGIITIVVTTTDEFTKGAAEEHFEVVVNIDINLFKGVWMGDRELVRDEEYDVRSGSTIVTIHQAYLDKLAAGEYAVDVVFTHVTMTTMMTILGADTGDEPGDGGSPGGGIDMMIIIIIAAVAIAAVGAAAYFLLRKRPETPKGKE
ncbi:MAG: hypothetical protein FWF40_00490, partial [Methanomassiliicoccaceae archaeon]|nr:hypothetical protein [Methanomassiliicoccaceae archaeon]